MTAKLDGTNGVVFPDTTTQSTAASLFASNQTWQNVASSRSANVTYTNSTGKPICVSIGRYGGDGSSTQIYVGGVVSATAGVDRYGGTEQMISIVPNGFTYQVYNSNGTVSGWYELR
jgi:hypothetical protein